MGTSEIHNVNDGNPVIKIILEKNEFFEGELINGYLYLKSFNLLKHGIIKYSLLNQEYYSYNENNKENIEEKINQSIIVNSLQYPQLIDYSFSKGINIPFSINLPQKLLPNFEYCLVKANGYVRNYIQIEIPELNLLTEQLIVIKKKFKLLKSLLSFTIEQKQNLLGIFNKGSLSLNASYKTNCYSFFSNIPLEIHINNNSDNNIDIIKIICKLLRNITFKNKNNNKDLEFNDILFINEMNVDKSLYKDNPQLQINTEINLEEPESLFNKYKLDLTNFNYQSIKDKQNIIKLIPDINSDLFICEYKIKIECIYKSFLKRDNICLYMPLSVYHENHNLIEQKKVNYLNNYEMKKQIYNQEKYNKPKNEKEKGNKENNLNENNIFQNKNKEKRNIKEPQIYTNYGNDDWNTPTNGCLNPRTE